MRLRFLAPGLVAVAAVLAACSTEPICTADSPPAIEVTILDAATQDYLTVTPRGVAREGAYQDSLVVHSTTVEIPPRVVMMAAAHERRGVYDVFVEAEGYQPWDTAGVAVSRDECHVITESFTAVLSPAP
jgi:hypothetical protein